MKIIRNNKITCEKGVWGRHTKFRWFLPRIFFFVHFYFFMCATDFAPARQSVNAYKHTYAFSAVLYTHSAIILPEYEFVSDWYYIHICPIDKSHRNHGYKTLYMCAIVLKSCSTRESRERWKMLRAFSNYRRMKRRTWTKEHKWCCHYSYCYFDCRLNLWCVSVILYILAVV